MGTLATVSGCVTTGRSDRGSPVDQYQGPWIERLYAIEDADRHLRLRRRRPSVPFHFPLGGRRRPLMVAGWGRTSSWRAAGRVIDQLESDDPPTAIQHQHLFIRCPSKALPSRLLDVTRVTFGSPAWSPDGSTIPTTSQANAQSARESRRATALGRGDGDGPDGLGSSGGRVGESAGSMRWSPTAAGSRSTTEAASSSWTGTAATGSGRRTVTAPLVTGRSVAAYRTPPSTSNLATCGPSPRTWRPRLVGAYQGSVVIGPQRAPGEPHAQARASPIYRSGLVVSDVERSVAPTTTPAGVVGAAGVVEEAAQERLVRARRSVRRPGSRRNEADLRLAVQERGRRRTHRSSRR